ncbi:unnamed protein product [Rotaria magnacalcarata]|uniref:Uncharacterized protein n=3 Tax=Rotaria magnacalcarata TaxID=392030 RepID=A0A816P424_9BILA|nr:unnamed protein product [Rotaria magnacalcarata]
MTTLLQKRTISMILTVPDIKESVSPVSQSIENLDQSSFFSLKNDKPLSIPIFHGSIIRIEQHKDDENLSDLILRVPNVHYLSLPSIDISSIINGHDQLHETESQQELCAKRRAPICPILKNLRDNTLSSNQNQPETNSPLINTKRLAVGLRNLSRAFTANCKSKPPSNVNEITIIPVLPDVEVITENFQVPKLSEKTTKSENSTSKFVAPKIFFIKRKHFRLKRKQPSAVSTNIEIETKPTMIENTSTNINSKDNQVEESKQTISNKINSQIEQKLTTNETIIPHSSILISGHESSSINRYSSILQLPSNSQITIADKNEKNLPSSIDISANIIQSNPFISTETVNLKINDIKSSIHIDNEQIEDNNSNIEERLYIVHPNGDTFSECYEVTYEFDPENRNRFNNAQEHMHIAKVEDQSLIKFKMDPFVYEDLGSTVTAISKITSNSYNEIEDDHSDQPFQESQSRITDVTQVKFHSFENISQINHDQISTYRTESISVVSPRQENDQILCLSDAPIVYEDYTIILQILKNVLQIDQLLQTDTTNELEHSK